MDTAAPHVSALLDALGLRGDPELADTPARFAELLAEFVPRELDPPTICATTSSAPVVVREIRFHSLCAHHLLPFFGTVAVAYRPSGRLLGFGSIPRLVAGLARRPQIQERLGAQIADALVAAAGPAALAVGVHARHLCVEMRGGPDVVVSTLETRGDIDDWLVARVESP